MPEPSFFQQVILDEMTGKNNAIHAYDRIVWIIRSGYITLVFGGWGLLVKGLIENNIQPCTVTEYIAFFLVMTAGLAIGGYLIDLNYLRRKFKVIAAYDKLMEEFKDNEIGGANNKDYYDRILPHLKIAGASGQTVESTGRYLFARKVAIMLYFITLAIFILGSVTVYIVRCCY